MIDTVLFDKDGTLFDFRATWGGWAASFLLDLSSDDPVKAAKMARSVGFDLQDRRFEEDSVLISGTPGDIVRRLLPHVPGVSAAGLVSRMNVMAAAVAQHEAVPLKPLLRDLHGRGLRLGVITNDARAPALAHLGAAGVVPFFDHVIGSDCGFGQKPGPGQILAFLEMTGADPARTVMVGDAPHDMIAARAAGCRRVAVLTGLATRAQLAPMASAVLADISGLPGWLESRSETRIDAA
ncbi:HAD family hydrolase [Mangrovicoccus algicola]|uniref:phosphoglycolate phosphatase n=1 Tax=Mangrovicoccus algicola TaxID=2771008 RepID=A0A8J7CZI5_9RHOB|nr:HAD family hydrolase [Mangrovicoccus algicola]MBE3637933.1 HAD family hydrolase [Mangrovicoccus algicola]